MRTYELDQLVRRMISHDEDLFYPLIEAIYRQDEEDSRWFWRRERRLKGKWGNKKYDEPIRHIFDSVR